MCVCVCVCVYPLLMISIHFSPHMSTTILQSSRISVLFLLCVYFGKLEGVNTSLDTNLSSVL